MTDTGDRSTAVHSAIKLFEKHKGMLRMSLAIELGIHRNTLYRMVQDGVLERISRGLYRLTDAEPLGNPDLVAVSVKVPHGVICLISALSYHELTTQIPHEVSVAIERNRQTPRIDYPPIRTFRFTGKAFSEGIEQRELDGFQVSIYSREKTIADCFKFRNQIGIDTAIEAIRFYKNQPGRDLKSLAYFASICRIEKSIHPYLESIL